MIQKNFFYQFLVIKALDPYWIRIGIQPKMLDPDTDEMNADPQPWYKYLNLKTFYRFSTVSVNEQYPHVNEPESPVRWPRGAGSCSQ